MYLQVPVIIGGRYEIRTHDPRLRSPYLRTIKAYHKVTKRTNIKENQTVKQFHYFISYRNLPLDAVGH